MYNTRIQVLKVLTRSPGYLRGPEGLHEIFSEIDFLLVSYRGDEYLSDAFGPIKNIVPSRSFY